MNEQQIKEIDKLACEIVNLLNTINQSPGIKTTHAHFREVAATDLNAIVKLARSITGITRPEIRRCLEKSLVGDCHQST